MAEGPFWEGRRGDSLGTVLSFVNWKKKMNHLKVDN